MKVYMRSLYNIILSSINVLFVLFSLIKAYSINNVKFSEILILYIIGMLIFMFLLKISRHKKIFLFFFIICISFIVLFNNNLEFLIKEKIVENIKSIEINMSLDKTVEYENFKYIFYVLIPIMEILVSLLIERNLELVVLLIDFILMVFLSFCGFQDKLLDMKYFFSIISILLVCFGMVKSTIIVSHKKNGYKNIDFKYIGTRLTIYCLVIFIITAIIPIEAKGIYYDKINNLNKQEMQQTLGDEKYIIDEGYNIKKSGYQDSNKKLGGKISLSDEKVMDVYSNESNLYLRGNVKELYTGHSWESLNKNLILFDETIKNDDKYLDFKDVIKKDTIKIVPVNSKLKAVFTPIYTCSIQSDEKLFTSPRYETFFFYKQNTKPYTIDYYKEKPIYNKMIETMKYNYKVESTSAYLDTSNITKNTLDLTLDLIAGCKNNEEKINKIIKYLKDNCEYSLDVSEVNDETEFVDNFLFKEKKGYCVYFATALAMMARIANIPSRYVEGFKLPNEMKNDGKYEVTNQDAHAWVEVIINPTENLWCTIDCSPTQRDVLKDTKSEARVTNEKKEVSITNENTSNNENEKSKDDSNEDRESKKQNEKKSYVNMKNISYIGLSLLAIIILAIIKGVVVKFKIKKILNSNDPLKIYLYYLNRVKLIKIYKKDNETDLEFTDSIEEINLKNRFKILVMESYKLIYGNNKVTVDGNDYGMFIDNYLKIRVNVIKYLLYKYILI